MTFDLRVPIGLLFAICGAILAIDGLVEHVHVVGVNINLWWGIVMVVFGGVMLWLARRSGQVRRSRQM
jgi:hypothetical protein